MPPAPLRTARRFLRSPRTIVLEVLAIAAAGVAMTAVPQVTDPAASARFALDHPDIAPILHALALDRVAGSRWFLGLVAIAACSLAIVVVEQWRRAARQWREPLSEASFRGAPYCRELERDVPEDLRRPGARFHSEGRLGLLGAPLFHTGLAFVTAAGLVRMLFGVDAAVDLIEGEVLPPDPAAYGAQWAGPLAAPFSLPAAIRLDRLEPIRYGSGALDRLAARVTILDRGERRVDLAINAPLRFGLSKLYLGGQHGPAALLEVRRPGGVERRAIPLREAGEGRYEAIAAFGAALEVRLRGTVSGPATLPESLEVRALRRGGLLYLGALRPGEMTTLASGDELILHSVRYWVRAGGSRDPSVGLAYAGFGLALLGAVFMVAVVKVDTAVVVRATEKGERVLVALRAQRFAPLYADRFEALVREEFSRGAAP